MASLLTPAQVCTQIITGGISCLPACSGGLITAHIFHVVGCVEVEVRPDVGGSYPLAPGEIGNQYQPVEAPAGLEDHPAFYVRPDNRDIFNVRNHVTIRVKFGEHVTEKEFIVSPRRAKTIVRVAGFINRTEERMKAVVSNLRRVSTHVVKALNFRKKR